MLPITQCYEVVARPKVGGDDMVLRRFRNHDAAAKHALSADMSHWDDIWVRPSAKSARPPPEPAGPPPMPWRIEHSDGRTFLVDADDKRLATFFGSPARREYVVGVLMQLIRSHANGKALEPTSSGKENAAI